jgi:FkbM family methyltransferase
MNLRLLTQPHALVQRFAMALHRRRRRSVLQGTPAANLTLGHLDSLELLQLLRDQPPGVIYDIGANAGTWTCLAKSLYPSARVEAFEPLNRFDREFSHWTSAWRDTVHLHRMALGATPGEATMHVTDFADASSLLPLTETGQAEFKIAPASQVTVPVARLDDLVQTGTIPPPDLIKLDVQGFELEVLRGAEVTLQTTRAVLCEVSTAAFYNGQPLLGEIVRHLETHGFRLHAFGANLQPGAPFAQSDALFVKQ